MCRALFYRTQMGRVAVWLLLAVCVGLVFLASACGNLNSDRFVEKQYCLLNSIQKTEPDVIHDENSTEICQSKIVLPFTVDQLKPPLLATLGLQIIVSPFLVVASLVALVGAWQSDARLIWPWLGVNTRHVPRISPRREPPALEGAPRLPGGPLGD